MSDSNNTYVKFVYCFRAYSTDEVLEESKLHKLSFYGNKNGEFFGYIGIEFGQCASPFDNLTYSSKALKICEIEPSDHIVNRMKELYPEKDLKCVAFLENVYTSHYYQGSIVCGKFIELEEDNYDKDVYTISHNLNLSKKFKGKELVYTEMFEDWENETHFTSRFEDIDPGNKLYNILTTRYENICQDVNSIIAFIPITCHCCT